MTHTLEPVLRNRTFLAIYRQGVRWSWIERAYQKWEVGAQPEPCEEELRGKEPGLATDCRCRGCIERQCMAMFTLVEKNAAGQYICSQRGHLYVTDLTGPAPNICRRCGHVREA
jgi:hypothetical protein